MRRAAGPLAAAAALAAVLVGCSTGSPNSELLTQSTCGNLLRAALVHDGSSRDVTVQSCASYLTDPVVDMQVGDRFVVFWKAGGHPGGLALHPGAVARLSDGTVVANRPGTAQVYARGAEFTCRTGEHTISHDCALATLRIHLAGATST